MRADLSSRRRTTVRARFRNLVCLNSIVIANCGSVRGLVPSRVSLLPLQTSTQRAIEQAVNPLAVSADGPAGTRSDNLKLGADSDDVFHSAIEVGTVSGTTSSDCARQTVGDLIYEMRGARHGVNISYLTIVSNRIVTAGLLVNAEAAGAMLHNLRGLSEIGACRQHEKKSWSMDCGIASPRLFSASMHQ